MVACPAIVLRSHHHAGADRIEFDVAVTGQHVFFALRETRSKATLPQGAAALIGAIDVLHVALAQVFHQQPSAVFSLGCEQQMHVVGHQHVGVYRAAELVGKLFEVVKVKLVVLFAVETDGAIVAALDDVPGNAGKGQAGATGHWRCEWVLKTPVYQKLNVVCPLLLCFEFASLERMQAPARQIHALTVGCFVQTAQHGGESLRVCGQNARLAPILKKSFQSLVRNVLIMTDCVL